MPDYLQRGWFETFLPVRADGAAGALRVWVEMPALVPLLRVLDRTYGSEAAPYCRDPGQRRAAQATLAELIVGLVRERPDVLKRVCAPGQLADLLADHHGVRRVELPVSAPAWLDQVDLEPADVAPLLPLLFDALASWATS